MNLHRLKTLRTSFLWSNIMKPPKYAAQCHKWHEIHLFAADETYNLINLYMQIKWSFYSDDFYYSIGPNKKKPTIASKNTVPNNENAALWNMLHMKLHRRLSRIVFFFHFTLKCLYVCMRACGNALHKNQILSFLFYEVLHCNMRRKLKMDKSLWQYIWTYIQIYFYYIL